MTSCNLHYFCALTFVALFVGLGVDWIVTGQKYNMSLKIFIVHD